MSDIVTEPLNTPPSDATGDESGATAKPSPTTPSARHKARRLALQALYSWHIGKNDPHAVEAFYRAENDTRKTDVVYFHELFHDVISQAAQLDAVFAQFLDRGVRDLDPIELAILRIGTYELQSRLDVPLRVAINEGIELCKEFGATDDSHKYINGVLDKVARKARPMEPGRR